MTGGERARAALLASRPWPWPCCDSDPSRPSEGGIRGCRMGALVRWDGGEKYYKRGLIVALYLEWGHRGKVLLLPSIALATAT